MRKKLHLLSFAFLISMQLCHGQCNLSPFIQAVPNTIFPCHNSCDGLLIIDPQYIFGTPPYTFTTDHGTLFQDQPNPGWATVTGLCEGDAVHMTVVDAANCTGQDNITMVGAPVVNPTIAITSACNSTASGSVTISNFPNWYFNSYLGVSTSNACINPWQCPGIIDMTNRQFNDNTPYTVINLLPGNYYFVMGFEFTDPQQPWIGCSQYVAFTIPNSGLPGANITPAGSTTFCSGGNVVLNAPTGNNKAYQWKKNSIAIAGATSSSYVATTSGNYRVVVTNTLTGCSKTSNNPVTVTVNALPTATATPQGPTTFCAGGSVLLKANTGAGLTYKWKKNNSNISGATSANYSATTAGNYKVQVTKNNGCSKISSAVSVNVPCREENEIGSSVSNFDFTVYPNPNNGEFTIQFTNQPASPVQVELTDMIGRVLEKFILSDESETINVPQIAKGIYCLKMQMNDHVVVKRISIIR
jgi:hypothetical protein